MQALALSPLEAAALRRLERAFSEDISAALAGLNAPPPPLAPSPVRQPVAVAAASPPAAASAAPTVESMSAVVKAPGLPEGPAPRGYLAVTAYVARRQVLAHLPRHALVADAIDAVIDTWNAHSGGPPIVAPAADAFELRWHGGGGVPARGSLTLLNESPLTKVPREDGQLEFVLLRRSGEDVLAARPEGSAAVSAVAAPGGALLSDEDLGLTTSGGGGAKALSPGSGRTLHSLRVVIGGTILERAGGWGCPWALQRDAQLPPGVAWSSHGTLSATVTVRRGMTAVELVTTVADMLSLPLFRERFALKVPLADQARLGLPSRELPGHLLLAGLGLLTVDLVRLSFADVPVADAGSSTGAATARGGMPPRPPLAARGGADGGGSRFNLREGDGAGAAAGTTAGRRTSTGATRGTDAAGTPSTGGGGVVYTPLTAAEFHEWLVIKTNKRGRRQERWLGIDLTRVTNRKTEKKRYLSSDDTVHAERYIDDIVKVEVPRSDPEKATHFTITFIDRDAGGGGGGGGGSARGGALGTSVAAFGSARGGGDGGLGVGSSASGFGGVLDGAGDASSAAASGGRPVVAVRYEARAPAEREAIVSKLAFILRMNGEGQRVVVT